MMPNGCVITIRIEPECCESHLKFVTKHDLQELKESIMSAISDYSAVVNTAFDAISTSVDEIVASQAGLAGDIANLKDIILKLQNNPGPISPEDQALLDAGVAKVTAIATKSAAVSEALKALDAQTDNLPPPPVP